MDKSDIVRVWLSRSEDNAYRVFKKVKGHPAELMGSTPSRQLANGLRRLLRLREGLHPDTLDPWDIGFTDAVKSVAALKKARKLNTRVQVTRAHQPKKVDKSISEWAVDLLNKRENVAQS